MSNPTSDKKNHINVTKEDVRKIAHLARLKVDEAMLDKHVGHLFHILTMIEHINDQDTNNVEPMFSAHNCMLQTRPDVITESNQREVLQKLAPHTLSGLYLVPKVIE